MICATVLLILVGWAPITGEPVYLHACPVSEVVASPEWATVLRHRNAQDLVALRLARANQTEMTPRATPVPAAVGDSGSYSGVPGRITWRPEVEQWRSLVARYFAPADVEHALAIIRCESLGDPDATHPSSGTAGLFQHRPAYWPARSSASGWAGHSPYEPEANIAVAAWLVYHGGGWGHWSGRAWGVDSCEEWACAQGVC